MFWPTEWCKMPFRIFFYLFENLSSSILNFILVAKTPEYHIAMVPIFTAWYAGPECVVIQNDLTLFI